MKANNLLILGVLAVTPLLSGATTPTTPKQGTPPREEAKAPDLTTQLKAAKEELARMRSRYREEHPAVKAQLRKIAELETRLAGQKAQK
ncbi:MAG: hypothetical protein Q7S40_29350 [Opitutaceae bacterium]|nr:hypothetical protein [Opitutaceae bacterium]